VHEQHILASHFVFHEQYILDAKKNDWLKSVVHPTK
jgi:hypothetical protein